jgi:hypothetical protein
MKSISGGILFSSEYIEQNLDEITDDIAPKNDFFKKLYQYLLLLLSTHTPSSIGGDE